MTSKEQAPRADAAAEPPPPRKRWWQYFSLGLSAFIMSVTITLINAFYSLRGPEIVVEEPDQVLLYRDGEGADAVLTVAMRVATINTAGGQHGDVMLEAEVEPRAGGPSFRYQALAQPVFTDAPDAASRCDVTTRCIGLPGLLVMEKSDQIVDLPGGAAQARYLSFPAAEWNCEGTKRACASYGNFNGALRQLEARPLDVRVRLHLHGDGDRTIICGGQKINANYLRQVGWLSLSCERRGVTGEPFL